MVDLCEKCGHRAVCRFREHYEECLQFIEDVVRCKDCKYRYTAKSGLILCTQHITMTPKPDDFCSNGERREGE